MGMTMTEKIVAKAAGRSHVTPGENVWVDVDLLITHNLCGASRCLAKSRQD